jgi:hypothetical protein
MELGEDRTSDFKIGEGAAKAMEKIPLNSD